MTPIFQLIIITGYPDSDLMMEALRHAPILVLSKPIESKRVLDALDLALSGSKSKRVFLERTADAR